MASESLIAGKFIFYKCIILLNCCVGLWKINVVFVNEQISDLMVMMVMTMTMMIAMIMTMIKNDDDDDDDKDNGDDNHDDDNDDDVTTNDLYTFSWPSA